MSEPGQQSLVVVPPSNDLKTLVEHQFPGSQVVSLDGQFVLMTVHGVGDTEQSAMETALKGYQALREDGQSLEQILDDIKADLAQPAMSWERHDSLIDLCRIAEQALDAGILTNTIPWILRVSYSRQIEALVHRIDMRLGMMGREAKLKEDAKKRASQTFHREPTTEPINTNTAGMTAYERFRMRFSKETKHAL